MWFCDICDKLIEKLLCDELTYDLYGLKKGFDVMDSFTP